MKRRGSFDGGYRCLRGGGGGMALGMDSDEGSHACGSPAPPGARAGDAGAPLRPSWALVGTEPGPGRALTLAVDVQTALLVSVCVADGAALAAGQRSSLQLAALGAAARLLGPHPAPVWVPEAAHPVARAVLARFVAALRVELHGTGEGPLAALGGLVSSDAGGPLSRASGAALQSALERAQASWNQTTWAALGLLDGAAPESPRPRSHDWAAVAALMKGKVGLGAGVQIVAAPHGGGTHAGALASLTPLRAAALRLEGVDVCVARAASELVALGGGGGGAGTPASRSGPAAEGMW
jgi:hypothetical protein